MQKINYLFIYNHKILISGIILIISCLVGALLSVNDQISKITIATVFVVLFICIGMINLYTSFIIFIFLCLTVWLSKITIYNNISLLIGVGLLFTITWIIQLIIQNKVFIIVKEYWYLFGIGLAIIISTIINWGGPAGFTSIFTYLQLLLLFIILINFLTNSSRIYDTCNVIIFSSVLLALIILMDIIGILPQTFLRDVENTVKTGVSIVKISRSAGLFNDPNYSAFQMVIAFPFIIEFWALSSRIKKFVLGISFVIILIAIIYTYSMGGLIGVISVLVLQIFIDRKKNNAFSLLKVLIIILIGIWIINIILPSLYIDRINENIKIINELIKTKNFSLFLTFGSTRGNTWQAALKSFMSSPIFGYGPGNSTYNISSYNLLSYSRDHMAAHNFLLSVATDIGIFGLLFFLGLVFSSLTLVKIKIENINQQHAKMRNAIYIAIIACIIQGLGLDIHTSKHLWVLIGMAIAYKSLSKQVINPNN